MIDKRPALIARCADADDVARAVAFARDHDLLLAVRGGGHNGAGLGTCDDGVVIDLSPLKDVEVDPEARTVRVGGGCTWGEVDAATNEHGLATPSGIISTTGVGGLTLGGGLGHLTRKCGLAIDNLLEAELVLASGEQVRASADENPDLFWAIRGGGGNFGVVTSFLFRLHEVGTVVAGPTFWPVETRRRGALGLPRVPAERAARAERLLRLPHRAAGAALPRGAPPAQGLRRRLVLRRRRRTTAAEAMAPLLDALPEPLHARRRADAAPGAAGRLRRALPAGRPVVLARRLRQGDPRRGGRRSTPGSAPRCRRGSRRCTCTRSTAPPTTSGRPTRPGATATRAGARCSPASIPTRRNVDAIRRWSVDYFEALHPYSAGGAYVNMMMDEGQERVRASYRDNYDRLARVKATYDPDNIFRVNQNIQPKA